MDNNEEKITNTITIQTTQTTPAENCGNVFKNHSNPLVKNLFKLAHSALNKNNEKYRSFSKFGPDDLR